jgi:chemotaxis protein MotA
MDFATLAGLVIAIGSVFGAFVFEGGKLAAIIQPTAFVIVIGGTIGALCVQYPGAYLKKAVTGVKFVFMPKKNTNAELIKSLSGYAQKARREGVVSLEGDASGSPDPFLKKALGLAVDGTESRLIRDAMEIELTVLNEEGEMGCKVLEAGGGYAPTVGILGAVLGRIQVMANLADPAKLGGGIATAFVATVYGVFFANIVFLPLGSKLKIRHLETMMRYELILAGVLAIVDGENPRIIEQKLQGYLGEHKPHAAPGEKAA